MNRRIGFMQGRLVPMIDDRIQCFPWPTWRQEIELAGKHEFALMEWTLDQDRLRENPVMTIGGRREIRMLASRHRLAIPSVTGDCFMQAPFWKADGLAARALIDNLTAVVDACGDLDIGLLIVPLVDNGSIENERQTEALHDGFERVLRRANSSIRIAFESDFPPSRLSSFIAGFDSSAFGINYDIGNSAALGHSAVDEFAAYAKRIINVHVKDRILGGRTVPLGEGNADVPAAIGGLEQSGYGGNYILQTARAKDGDDVGAACRYRDMTAAWIREAA